MKGFFKTVLATLVALALFLVIGVALLGVVLSSGQGTPVVKEKTLLTLDLSIPIVDKPPREDFGLVLDQALNQRHQGVQVLRELVTALDRGAADDRISGLFIKGQVARSGYRSGWAALRELRQAIERFRASGKPVITWQEELDEATLYVVSAASRVVLHPLGTLEFNGLGAEIFYFKKAFDRYGVQVQVTRAGKYKSAVEPFIREHMSPENREQIADLLADIFDELVTTVATVRKLDPEKLRRLSREQGMLTAAEAAGQGVIDAAGYYDQVLEKLRALTDTSPGEPIERQKNLSQYFAALEPDTKGKGKIALIYAEGTIVPGNGEEEVAGQRLARLLRKAREDDDIKAVVLRVNSPGGSAVASEVIERETRLLRKRKPLVVSMGTVAASGGYWISAYADELWAEPTTITGSIGVFGLFLDLQQLVEEHGLNVERVNTSPLAHFNSIFRPRSPRELALAKRLVDQIYQAFIERVAEGRHLAPDKVESLAQGRVWSGRRAHELGLVDKLGGLREALDAAAQRAGLEEGYRIVEYQRAEPFLEVLMRQLGLAPDQEGDARQNPDLARLWNQLRNLIRLADPKGFYARLPFDLVVR